jgi:hypothetical protein
MTFSPQLFLSNLQKHDGPAKTNRFQVILPIPAYIGNFISMSALQQILDISGTIQDLTENLINGIFSNQQSSDKSYSDAQITRYLGLQCESAELPGISLMTQDVKIYGPTYKLPYQKQYNDLNLTFICTNDFYERKLFDRWIEAIMPGDTNNMRFPKGDQTKYLTDITVVQFDEFVKQIYAVKIIDAFPTSIAPMQVSWSDDGFHKLTVSFAYQRYETIYKGSYNIGQAVASGLGTVFDRFLGDFRNSILTS